jgi:phosphoribosyl 1,2-cyclic phosphodiesterase
MRFCVLGSGSKGNATFVECGKTRLLIDAGFSGREIEGRLAAIGVAAESLAAILITHEHSDHVRGAAILSRRHRLPLFANQGTFAAAGAALAKPHEQRLFVSGESFVFQDLRIHPYSVSHDAADPVGFLLSGSGLVLGYCTDTGMVSRLMQHRLSQCHGLVLECNHDPDLLRNGPYPPALQQRVRSRTGHLANGQAGEFLRALLHPGLEHVVLSHLSETNNRPEVALETVRGLLAAGEAGEGPVLSLACQERVGELVRLGGTGKG